ncbi:MAG TPA: peptidylprolyl isomerase [Blastocatellia bacterium]|nr:peptidylprolyl isomerase [Blastocatellia bacterium]
MKLPGKVIATIAVVVALAGIIIWAQRSLSRPARISLSSKDMEALVGKFSPDQVRQLTSNPSQKQSFVDDIKKTLAVGAAAEAAGYADRPAIKSQITFQTDLLLATQYQQKNANVKIGEDEIAKFNQANPQAFDEFIQNNPRFQQQAAGPQREQLKRAFAELKTLAGRAKAEGLAKDRGTELQLLVSKYDILSSAYEADLRNDDKLVTEADLDNYYKQHPEEFNEVRARHILIATGSPQDEKDDEEKGDDKKSKPLTKDEARKKAESILQRIQKGEDFATLAKENSDDPGSKTSGGDLGYFAKGKMVPEFEAAAFALKPGQTSGLVETKYGFHIIKVEDVRQLAATDPKVRQEMTDKLKNDAVEKRIDQIVKSSKVSVAENFELPEPPASSNPHQGQMPAGHP